MIFLIKVFFSFIFATCFSGILKAQVPTIQWQKTYGGTNDEEAHSICTLKNGDFVIVGSAKSNNGNVSNHHPLTPGFYDRDFWLIKVDSLGNLLWNKCYGGSGGDDANSLIQTLDGGFIMAGYTYSEDGDVIGLHGSGDDFWIVKTDSLGNLQWQKCLGGDRHGCSKPNNFNQR